MPTPPTIENAPRAESYSPVASAGPFTVPFPLFDSTGADLRVSLDGVLKVVTTDWTLAADPAPGFWGAPNTYINGAITFLAPITGTLVIVGRRAPRRTQQYAEGRGIPARDINTDVNVLTAIAREHHDRFDRVLELRPGDVNGSGAYDARGNRITALGTPTGSTDAVTKDYADAAVAAETAARIADLAVETNARVAQDIIAAFRLDDHNGRIFAVANAAAAEPAARSAADNVLAAQIAAIVAGGAGASVSSAVSHKAYPTAAASSLLSTLLDDSAINLRGLLTVGTGATAPQRTANTAVINAATADATLRGNGVPTILPPGIILADPDLLIRDNAPIVGRGVGLTTLKLRPAAGNCNFIRTENYTDKTQPTKSIHLEGFTVDLDGAAQTPGASVRGIGIAYADRAIFRRIGIKNVVDMGLWFIPDMGSLGTSGAYGGQTAPPNRPDGDPWVSGDVLMEHCEFDASNATSTATDFIIPVSIQRLTVNDCVFRGGYRNCFGPEWVRELNMRGNKFYGVASGLYSETIWHANIESTYIEGIHQLNQADWNSPLHNTAIWLATADDTLGSATVNNYWGARAVKVMGTEIYAFSRPAPTAGNVQAGGVRGICISARNSGLPAGDIIVSDSIIASVEGLGYQAGLGGATAFGVGIQVAGAGWGIMIHDNRMRSLDVGMMFGGPYPDNAATLGTITPSNDLTDDLVAWHNNVRDYKIGILAKGSIVGSRWERNRVRAQRSGGAIVDESGIAGGSAYVGGAGNQYNEG